MSGTLLADAVTWLFTSVLKGLQTHGQHDGCMASLVHLAFQIYEALVSGQCLAAPGILSFGICHTAFAAPQRWVWHGIKKVTSPAYSQ